MFATESLNVGKLKVNVGENDVTAFEMGKGKISFERETSYTRHILVQCNIRLMRKKMHRYLYTLGDRG